MTNIKVNGRSYQVDNIWFTGDYHLGHANIIRYCNRPFTDTTKMDAAIIDNVNALVKPKDALFFVGDFCFSAKRQEHYQIAKEYRERINCQNIFFNWGNHDKNLRKNPDFRFLWIDSQDIFNISVGNTSIVSCHYAMEVWDKSHYGSWHVFGHSHGNLDVPNYKLKMDVGVDCNDYSPFSFENIAKMMIIKESVKEGVGMCHT